MIAASASCRRLSEPADAQRFLGERQVLVLLKPFELTALLERVER